ncbi:MAG TPA: hypothetical protein PLB31_09425 [Fimbriimonadaceae bacterium]|nr:hypothetical protein [Armatimonadota bacterium]HRD32217.1 hypothetical protein [Fimbriimonadaceae bacterium]HRE93237.1 hypothetical protein [Fimbriimonadaceae bacterium]HRI74673.1 hypothetical protein [Fimbriimonadaceae bacterium]
MLLRAFLLAAVVSSAAGYSDPGGAFAIDVPSGYKAERYDLGDGAYLTEIAIPDNDDSAHCDILSYKSPEAFDASQHATVNKALLDVTVQLLSAESTVTKQSRAETTYQGRKATKMTLEFKDEDGVAWKGYALAVCGTNNALVVMPYAKASDANGFKIMDETAQTLAVEGRTPLARGAGGAATSGGGRQGGFLNQGAMRTVEQRVDGNFQRESASKVIVAGQPPLTYGSVANFVTVIEILFDIQMTEAEFEATRARFIEYYNAADAEGKQVLALQGAELLKTLTTGTEAEREQSRNEGRAVFEQAFSRGAEMGIGYAQVMWDAITRRRASVQRVAAQPTKEEWDQDISEGDIDALMEMLWFMWNAAGRPTEGVTMDDINQVRMGILQELPTMDAQAQLLIANAPKLYAGLRQQWMGASAEQRMMLAAQFDQALNEWGIGAQSGFESGGGGGGGDSEYSMNAQIAQNTAWNAAKTWSSGS